MQAEGLHHTMTCWALLSLACEFRHVSACLTSQNPPLGLQSHWRLHHCRSCSIRWAQRLPAQAHANPLLPAVRRGLHALVQPGSEVPDQVRVHDR